MAWWLPLLAIGLRVGVEIVSPPGWGTIGCHPAAFSTSEAFANGGRGRSVIDVDAWTLCGLDVEKANATAAMRAKVEGTVVLVAMLTAWNPWVAWSSYFDQPLCSPVKVAQRAHELGADAVLFAAAYLNQVPYAIVGARGVAVAMPVCMTWWSERNRIVGQLGQQGEVVVQLHDAFRLYDRRDEPWPQHFVTSLTVFNPPSLAWTYPAGQATYNPAEVCQSSQPPASRCAPVEMCCSRMWAPCLKSSRRSWARWCARASRRRASGSRYRASGRRRGRRAAAAAASPRRCATLPACAGRWPSCARERAARTLDCAGGEPGPAAA